MKKIVVCVLFCVLLSLGLSADNAQFGLNTHNFPCEHPGNNNPARILFEDLGIKWTRGGIEWQSIETNPSRDPAITPVYDFTWTDQIFQYAQSKDVHVVFVLSAAPTTYSYLLNNNKSLDPANPICRQRWASFVTAMVERYDGDGNQDMPGTNYGKPFIKHWELWNEANLHLFWHYSNDAYDDITYYCSQVLQPGIAAIRAADPQAKICGPDFSSSTADGNPKDWLDYISGQGIIFDVLTHHQYDGGDSGSGRFSALQEFYNHAVTQGYSGKDFWVTETGWVITDDDAVENMEYMFDRMVENGSWWKKTFWYAWRASDGYLIDPTTGTPNALYYAYKRYSNPSTIAILSPNGGESWYRGETKTISWNANEVGNVKIELLKGAVSVLTISPSTPAANGSLAWLVPAALAVGADYRILISDVNDASVYDVSDVYFSIKAPGTSILENGGFESNWTGWPDRNGVYAIATPAYTGSKACKLTGSSMGSNLIVNGGFESNWTNWPTRFGNFSLSATCRSGSYSCQLAGGASSESGVNSSAYSVTAGNVYKLTSYVKYASGPGNYKVTIAWRNGSGGVIRYDNDWKGTNKPSSFTYHGGTFTAPTGTVTAVIMLGVSAGTTFLFDDVALQAYNTFESSVASSVYAADAGRAYRLNSYVKYLGGSGNYKVTIAWLNSANGVIRYDNDWKGTNRPANYTYHGGTFTSPANTAKVRIIVGAAPDAVYLFDAIELIPQ